MDNRQISIAIALVVLGFLAYWLFFPKIHPIKIEEELRGKPIGYGRALEKLTNASDICIVEDVNVRDPVRKNIMMCGVNLASSAPKYGKHIYAYAIEGSKCYRVEGEASIAECLSEIKRKGCFIVLIGSENAYSQESYENMLVIPVGKEISERDCTITT